MKKLSPSALSLCVIAALGLTACGPDENAEVNTTLVEGQLGPAVESMMAFRSGKAGADAIGPLMSLGNLGQAMLTPEEGKTSSRTYPSVQDVQKMARMARDKGGEECACDEHKCVFDGCELGIFGKLEGGLQWTETSLNCDYKAEFSIKDAVASATTKLSTFCDLKFSETTLDGELRHSGSIMGKSDDHESGISWESSIVFDGIKYDDDAHKITEGSANVEAEVAVTGEDTLRGSASIDFSNK